MTTGTRGSALFSIMAVNRFVEATRDSGYKGTGSAVSELVDNALQAGARKISITLEHPDNDSSNIKMSVWDNGCGMDPFTLRQALQFGGSSRFNDRNGIGRYGMGLPNSSLSQAKHVRVYSWKQEPKQKNGTPCVYSTYLDLDAITQGQMKCIPAPKLERNPPKSCVGKSGTLVVWSHCDRLDNRLISTLVRKLKDELGHRFRYYIWGGVQITVNSELIKAVDPLFFDNRSEYYGARQYGKELIYEVSTNPSNPEAPAGFVKVRFTELPVKRWRKLSNEDKRRMRISKGAGVSIVRAGREVDTGWFFMGSKRKENYDDWWRCEISFDPILDEAFGITHTKQQVRPSEYLSKILTPDLEAIARVLNSRARNAHQDVVIHASSLRPSTRIAIQREKLLPPLPSNPNIFGRAEMKRLSNSHRIMHSGSSSFEYQIVSTNVRSTTFFSFGLTNKLLVLALNKDHPFFRELGGLKDWGASQFQARLEALIELLLLSAVRSEASEKSQHGREIIENFRIRWSNILATYINR